MLGFQLVVCHKIMSLKRLDNALELDVEIDFNVHS